ncbi:MAG: DUF3526 domain-containing protein [Pseudomonadota bacterium]
MSAGSAFVREAAFVMRDRAIVTAVFVALVLSIVSVTSGSLEVRDQQRTIGSLLETDAEERRLTFFEQSDWGSAAYYSFHLTYDPPSAFAFAALGQRDSTAWKHRVRMLAMEGQIHERDAGNPVFALIGRFDFAFLVTFVVPLLLIALLHDLRAAERAVGRHDLLVATATNAKAFWFTRATVRAVGVYIAVIIPLIIGGVLSRTSPITMLLASAAVALYIAFWMWVCLRVSAWQQSAGAIVSALLGVWVLLAVVVPALGRIVIDQTVSLPHGSDILLTQREAVNDAWDLPVVTTMDAFVARHPEWAPYTEVGQEGFEWKWYYAFQQVGDQHVEPLTNAYREGRLLRDRWASRIALLSPPALMERTLQKLADTDIPASIAYELEVRRYHDSLREFYYPKLFKGEAFDPQAFERLPVFTPIAQSR